MGQNTRKARLEQLLRLAQTYRGWTRKELARALGRDTTKLVPASGLPKLDIVMDLARVLDWPVEDVAQHLWAESATEASAPEDADLNFTTAEQRSRDAHRDGRYHDALRLARHAHAVSVTGEERAIASNREAAAWDGLGRYNECLRATRRGLGETGVSTRRRLILQSNLSTAYYSLWQLIEARGTAQCVIEWLDTHAPTDQLAHVVLAHGHYVRGNAYRRLMTLEPENHRHCAELARRDLDTARTRFLALADEHDDDSYRGVAHTCEGGLLELDACLGNRDPRVVLERFADALNGLVNPNEFPSGDWLESYGWWCILGCNVALRHVTDERALQSHMAIFTNKADEIAERLDNWSLRERVFTMEYARRQRFADWTGVESDWTIDHDDVRIIAGTMGRFPAFHRTGWRILQSAKVVVEA
ncbi:MAG: hypothetical protein HKO59_15240 [Phycisphaerales bacterium]|nr:hypothetical protein [Phycisphaerae bacterium]NNF41936.1 hypothetical protein [Phycisphaerales bacterium]NNM27314.1 hypothetical protein [Phycisphaerales bacterium]